ncbi:MAG: hypothetical protein SNJ71_06005 [Bacteroidales bacterium]
MKKLIKTLLLCLILFNLSNNTFSQEIEIINTIKVSVDAANDLEYFNENFYILSLGNIIRVSKEGKIVTKEKTKENIKGITTNKQKSELIILNENGDIKNMDGSTLSKINPKETNVTHHNELKFIEITDNGYISFTKEGWSSRISFFNSTGYEITSILSPGLGDVSGIGYSNGNIWIVSDLGEKKNGIFRKYELLTDSIVEKEVFEIPIKQPQGLTIDNEGSFFTYSEETKQIVNFKLKK